MPKLDCGAKITKATLDGKDVTQKARHISMIQGKYEFTVKDFKPDAKPNIVNELCIMYEHNPGNFGENCVRGIGHTLTLPNCEARPAVDP
jgi:hypothetical protein